MTDYRRKRREQGLCVECGEPSGGKWVCDRHRDAQAKRSQKYRLKQKAQGLCPFCGKPAAPFRQYCEKHRKENTALSLKQKEKRLEEGRCGACGRPKPEDRDGFKSCYCHANRRASKWS